MTTPQPSTDPTDAARFRVEIEEGSPHGGLYELEVDTTYRVVDAASGETVLTFTGQYSASFDGDGQWGEPTLSGVVKVELGESGGRVLVHFADGRVDEVALPA